MPTLYDLLEVSESAPPDKIRLAYDRLMLQAEMAMKDSQPQAYENRVKVLNDTFAVLGDPQRRSSYDRKLQTRRTRQRQGQHNRLFDGGLGEAFRVLFFKPIYVVPVMLMALVWIVWPSHDNPEQQAAQENAEGQADTDAPSSGQLLQMAVEQQQRLMKQTRDAQRLATEHEARLEAAKNDLFERQQGVSGESNQQDNPN